VVICGRAGEIQQIQPHNSTRAIWEDRGDVIFVPSLHAHLVSALVTNEDCQDGVLEGCIANREEDPDRRINM
jgi:hypothetical protein